MDAANNICQNQPVCYATLDAYPKKWKEVCEVAEQKQRASGTLPKNIRQIGTSIGSTRVYLEDYVYTYLHTQDVQETWTHRGFVLLGRVERGKDYTRYFISGMVRVEDEFFKDQILQFSDETWTAVYKELKQYFDNLEIVGWGQDVSNGHAGLAAELERNHKQHFNIQKNVLFLLDQAEKEEAFYVFEKNVMQRREGYYVYYEKNPQMQDYMIEKNNSKELNIPAEGIEEPLVNSYRAALLEKKAQISQRKWNGVLYTTSLLLVLSVCVLGISTVNNVEKMQNLESTVNRISGQADGDVPAMSPNVKEGDMSDLNQAKASDGDGENQESKASGGEDGNEDNKDSGSSQETSSKTSDNNQQPDGKTTNGSQHPDEKTTNDSQEPDTKTTNDSQQPDAETADGKGTGSKTNGSKPSDADSSSGSRGTGSKASDSKPSGTKSNGNDSSSKEDGETSDAAKDEDKTKKNDGAIDADSLSEEQKSLLQGYYVVKEGDSLVGISRKIYGTTAKARKICQLNGIDDMDMIYAGQRLELP